MKEKVYSYVGNIFRYPTEAGYGGPTPTCRSGSLTNG